MNHRRKKSSKEASLRRHSFKRALERYPHLDLTNTVRGEIVAAIRNGESARVERQSKRVVIHDVTLKDGRVIRVAYDNKRGVIITFLYTDETKYAVTV